jgi:hypothetical protein
MTVWLANHRDPIQEKETQFLKSKDLITLSRKEKAPMRRAFEQYVLAPTSGLFGLFSAKRAEATKVDLRTTTQGDDQHVDVIAAVAIFAVAITMLIAPLWILAVLDTIFRKLAVITAFSVVFLAVLNWGTIARPFEIFAATAG